MFLSFDPPTIGYSGTPSSIKNVFSACTASDFLAIEYISEKYVPLENICAYWFQSKDFNRPYIIYVARMPVSLLV